MSLPHTDENCSHMPCRYERLAWIPVLIVYLVALGVGGKHLTNPPPAEPATAPAILSFGATIAGFVITYCSLSSDFTIYYARSVPSWRLFMYSYLGFNIPIVRHRSFLHKSHTYIYAADPLAMSGSSSGAVSAVRTGVGDRLRRW